VANAFLNAKKALVDSGELSPRTWQGYKGAAEEAVTAFGKSRLVSDLDPSDFEKHRNKLARRLGPHGLGTSIQCVRCLFKYATDSGLVAAPVRYGAAFKKPRKKVLRLHRAGQGATPFTAEEVRSLAEGALVVGEEGPDPGHDPARHQLRLW
jgi:hypothetical protein